MASIRRAWRAGDPGVRPLEMVAADRNAAARFEEILSARGLRWQSRIEEIDAIES